MKTPTAVDASGELDAMRAIGQALETLPDRDTRLRVLRWAVDRLCRERPERRPAEARGEVQVPQRAGR